MNEPSAARQRIKSNLLTLGSAATLAVYAAGFFRTRAAAQQFPDDIDLRRPVPPNVPTDSIAPAPVEPSVVVPPAGVRSIRRPLVTARATVDTPTTIAIAPDSLIALTAVVVAKPETPAPVPQPVSADTSAQVAEKAVPRLKDGVYLGYGTSRHGDIEASVEIKAGRIVAASITQCLTRYSCSWIDHLPGQVVARQSGEVDYVSGATQSSNAFRTAIIEALYKAK